ncbi:MAG: hypothetical protein AB2591_03990 [Candidatus Thiodiazotropha sp.]
MKAIKITPKEFIDFEKANSRSSQFEWLFCLEPKFYRYRVSLTDFLQNKVYPTYRLNNSGAALTGAYEDSTATPISFIELKERPELLEAILNEGYVSENDSVLVYRCERCGVTVVKDGIHRISRWMIDNEKKELSIYEVVSTDWSKAIVDMPNFCKCATN